MRSKENTTPEAVVKYVSNMDNHTLAMHLKAYKVSADLYGLPPYLVALLNEAINRIKDREHES
jgi:hypothetical protein